MLLFLPFRQRYYLLHHFYFLWIELNSFSFDTEAKKEQEAEYYRQYTEKRKLEKQKENKIKKQKKLISTIIKRFLLLIGLLFMGFLESFLGTGFMGSGKLGLIGLAICLIIILFETIFVKVNNSYDEFTILKTLICALIPIWLFTWIICPIFTHELEGFFILTAIVSAFLVKFGLFIIELVIDNVDELFNKSLDISEIIFHIIGLALYVFLFFVLPLLFLIQVIFG